MSAHLRFRFLLIVTFISLQWQYIHAQIPLPIAKADSMIENGDYIKAEVFLNTVKEAFQLTNDCEGTAWTATRLARAYEYSGRGDLAQNVIEKGYQNARSCKITSSAAFGTLVMLKGELELQRGNLSKSAMFLQNAAQILSNAQEFEQLTWTFTTFAVCMYWSNKIDSAEFYLDKAREVCKAHLPEDHVANSLVLDLYAMVYTKQGNNGKALENAFQNIAFYQQFGSGIPDDTLNLANTYNSIASIYFLAADYAPSIAYYERAIWLLRNCTVSDSISLGRILNNLGGVYERTGADLEANRHFIEARQLLAHPPSFVDAKSLYVADINLCDFAIREVDYDAAEHHLENAQAVAGTWGISLDLYYFMKGELLAKQSLHQQAILAYQKSLEIVGEFFTSPNIEVGAKHLAIARCQSFLGIQDSALFHLQKAIFNYSYAFESDNPKPKAYFPDWRILTCLTEKGEILYAQGTKASKDQEKIKMAYWAFSTGVEILMGFRKENRTPDSRISLTETSLAMFEGGVRSALDLYEATENKQWFEAAFQLSEQSKGMAMLESQWEAKAKGLSSLPDYLREEEHQISRDISFYKGQILKEKAKRKNVDTLKLQTWEAIVFEQERAMDAWERQVRTDYPNYIRQKHQDFSISPQQIADSLLNADEVFIEFFYGKSEIFTFIISKTEMRHFRQPSTPEIASQIKGFIHSVSDYEFVHDSTQQNFAQFVASGMALYDALLKEPLRIAKGKTVVLIPDQQLHQIPFEALLTKAPSTSQVDFSSLPYLLHDYAIEYGFSGFLLLEAHNRPEIPRSGECLAFAPTYDLENSVISHGQFATLRDGDSPLEGAQLEIEAVAKLGVAGKFLFGKYATEDQFKVLAKDFRILHLAMHGQADLENPNHSNFRFSTQTADTCEDQKLYAYEILELDLPTELAILSACETGTGKIQSGEGVMSLTRNFVTAGARSVVSSLWKIDDKVSAELIGRLYAKLVEGASVTEALHHAKLDFLKTSDSRTAHPYYWAGIVGHGDAVVYQKASNWKWLLFPLALIALGLFILLALRKRNKAIRNKIV